ncbi:hypothetical protein [Bdellovibrio sp. HCB209]|uniref:hypothetical protein n=1 Tax=Bdellovibrio sp. HCB209 TaxID=3394354 RepID=UPI0039B68588
MKASFFAAAGVILPVLLLLFLLGKVVSVSNRMVAPIASSAFPELYQSRAIASELVTMSILAVASLLLGAVALTSWGRATGGWIERNILNRISVYRGLKDFSQRLIPSERQKMFQAALLKREDEMNALVYVVEEFEQNYVIFTPSVPAPLSGSLFIVPKSDVQILNIPVLSMAKIFSRWGVGTAELLREAHALNALQTVNPRSPQKQKDRSLGDRSLDI